MDKEKLETFLADYAKAGHRPESVHYIRSIAGKTISEEEYVLGIKASVLIRKTPNRAKQEYRYLISQGVILKSSN